MTSAGSWGEEDRLMNFPDAAACCAASAKAAWYAKSGPGKAVGMLETGSGTWEADSFSTAVSLSSKATEVLASALSEV